MTVPTALTLALVIGSAQPSAANPAVPLDPVTAVLDAFRTHALVALGDGAHANEQAHAFRLALIRDSRFAATVNDIVVECGSARYQEDDEYVRTLFARMAIARLPQSETDRLEQMCVSTKPQ